MNYHELVQAYFERSQALTWYWTVYIVVIGGILAFSSFRLRPDLAVTVLITILYVGFAYKNAGAIEATTREREAFLTALKGYPGGGPDREDVNRIRAPLEPTLQPATVGDVIPFHIGCDLLTVAVLWVKEWRRRTSEPPMSGAVLRTEPEA